MNNFCSNQVREIIFERSCVVTLDPARSTSKFSTRAYMGSSDTGDPGDLSNILHLEH